MIRGWRARALTPGYYLSRLRREERVCARVMKSGVKVTVLHICRPLAGFDSMGGLTPGYARCASLTRGYTLPPLRGSLSGLG